MTEITIERLKAYDEADALALGELMTYLSEKCDGAPIPEDLMRMIIESEHHDQIVARCKARIVGAATVSMVMNVGRGNYAVLDAFVVDPSMRGKGVADMVWQELMRWCEEHAAQRLEFTSNQSRAAAHKFYFAHGATVRETTVFAVAPSSQQ